MTRSVANQFVKPSRRTLDCGHTLTFELSPPPAVGEVMWCRECHKDDPPRRVVKVVKVVT